MTAEAIFNRLYPGTLIAGALTLLAFLADLPGLWGTVLQELGRGVAAMAFNGIAASLGVLVTEEIFLFESFGRTALRLILLVFPHMALGLLWQRYRWKGGLATIAAHLAWNQWFSSPYWLIPTIGMAAIYLTLLFHKESVPA